MSLIITSFDPYADNEIARFYARYFRIPVLYCRAYGDAFTRFHIQKPGDPQPSFCEIGKDLMLVRDEPLLLLKLKSIKRVVIFAHEFFDAPAIMGRTAFESYWEWLETTLNLVRQRPVSILIKRHPFGTDHRNLRVWKEFTAMHCDQGVEFIEQNIPALDLVDNSSLAVTFRGTVTLELVQKGRRVVTCADSPFSRLALVENCSDLRGYKQLLIRILDEGLEERAVPLSSLALAKQAFSGEGIGSEEKYFLSFDCHPDTRTIPSIYERMILERSEMFEKKWIDYYKGSAELERLIMIIRSHCY